MANLILHCGARHVERRTIVQAETPTATPSWVPIPHIRLLELVESTLTGSGLTIANEAHALWSDHLRHFGLMEVVNGDTAHGNPS